jgi:hypothetical protein
MIADRKTLCCEAKKRSAVGKNITQKVGFAVQTKICIGIIL